MDQFGHFCGWFLWSFWPKKRSRSRRWVDLSLYPLADDASLHPVIQLRATE
jgi:hypothetical protein